VAVGASAPPGRVGCGDPPVRAVASQPLTRSLLTCGSWPIHVARSDEENHLRRFDALFSALSSLSARRRSIRRPWSDGVGGYVDDSTLGQRIENELRVRTKLANATLERGSGTFTRIERPADRAGGRLEVREVAHPIDVRRGAPHRRTHRGVIQVGRRRWPTGHRTRSPSSNPVRGRG
jgi:hypothetical protein